MRSLLAKVFDLVTSVSASGANSPRKVRVRLSRASAPVSLEFVLIASSALALTGLGLVMVLSASSAESGGADPLGTWVRQLVFAALAIPSMFLISRVPIRGFKKLAWPLIILSIGLQLLVFTPLGYEINENRNWIDLGFVQAQPSEFMKLTLAIWLGYILSTKQDRTPMALKIVAVSVAAIGTVAAGNDLGTAMVMLMIVLGALFFAGVKLRWILLPLLLAGAGVVFMALTSSNRLARILGFMREDCLEDYYSYDCYQPLHGTWSLASGGIIGRGLGDSTEKYGWLPAASNDYIFAIVGEELGLIGCLIVFALFGVFTYAVLRMIRRADSRYVRIVSGAILVWIVGQATLNVGVVLRVFPVLGVPLPFLSQGGTSLFAVLCATGVLLAMTRSLPVQAKTINHIEGS